MRRKLLALAGGAAAATALVPTAVPAASASFDADAVWGDEVALQKGGSVSSGNVVGMWQEILSITFNYGEANVDGSFGTGTENATKYYQGNYGVTVDGVVGTTTWNVARYIAGTTISPTPCTNCYYEYAGDPDLSLYWKNQSGGTWKWAGHCKGSSPNPPSTHVPTDYPTPSFNTVC